MADKQVRLEADQGVVINYMDNGDGTWSLDSAVGKPSASAARALVPSVNNALGASRVLKGSAGNLYGYNVVAGATAGYIMLIDSATVPADGAVTPKICLPLAANAGTERSFSTPIRFSTGIVIVFSSTGPFTKTESATAFIGGEVV